MPAVVKRTTLHPCLNVPSDVFPRDEAALYGLLDDQHDIPTPSVRHTASGVHERELHLEVVEGISVARARNPETRRALAVSTSQQLAAIHSVDPYSLGSWLRWPGWKAWRETLHLWLLDVTRQLGAYPCCRDIVATSREWLASLPTAPRTAPALVHGDFNGTNVVVNELTCSTCAILDWDWATIGDPCLDLVKISLEARALSPARLIDPVDWPLFQFEYENAVGLRHSATGARLSLTYRFYSLVQILPYLLASILQLPGGSEPYVEMARCLMDIARDAP